MNNYSTDMLKNICLAGNSGSGKTTLAEAMLFESGLIERRGSVEQKNTISDFTDIEHEYRASVSSSVMYAEYNNKKINLIDCPGSDDFIGGLIAAIEVSDTAVIVVNSHNGIEVETEIHFRNLEEHKQPSIFLFNQLDHEKSAFEKTIEIAKERLSKNVTIVQYPLNEGKNFDTIIDVLIMKMIKYTNGKSVYLDIPQEELAKAQELHSKLVEKAAENDDNLMELFFEKGELEVDELRKGINLGLLHHDIFPVFCCSAKNCIGVDRFMDFIANVSLSPLEGHQLKTSEGEIVHVEPNGSTSIFIFKTHFEHHIGEISFFRVIRGEVTENMDLVNNNNQTKERIGQLFISNGKNRVKVSKLYAGDIGCTVKLKNSKTNHTLTAPNKTYIFDPIVFPEPRYRTAIKAKNESDEEKLSEALNRMHLEDPTLIVEHSKELKQTLVYGQGEHHINTMKWHLDNEFKIVAEFITPKISYRETITKMAQADYRHKKQSGGAGQFGEVHLIVEPYIEGLPDNNTFKINGKDLKLNIRDKEEHLLPWGGKLIFYNCIVGGAIDSRFLPAILKGIMEKMEEGPLTGSYARDIKVYIYDGKMHPVDSNEISFKLAGRNAFKEAFRNAGPKIMEPIQDVEIWVPADRMGDVMGDLQTRRAIVMGMASEKGFEKITAKVPLAEMNRYSTSLSSLTQGRAMYKMQFAEYAQVPSEVQAELLKAYDAVLEEV